MGKTVKEEGRLTTVTDNERSGPLGHVRSLKKYVRLSARRQCSHKNKPEFTEACPLVVCGAPWTLNAKTTWVLEKPHDKKQEMGGPKLSFCWAKAEQS